MLTREEYSKLERKQTIHRTLNTILLGVSVIFGAFFVEDKLTPVYEELSGITEQKIIESEIDQIAEDEGYRPCPYRDSLGLKTVGFGTLIEGQSYGCIKGHDAIELLRAHYNIAKESVERRYPWAEGEKKLILINLSYNMGETRLAKFKKMLYNLEQNNIDKAAGELLDSKYAKQVPNRAGRMAGRIMKLGE
tara:strand:- start:887 stop:1462 length:576 start_codon:yes stop_codon:yes gene_type:complete